MALLAPFVPVDAVMLESRAVALSKRSIKTSAKLEGITLAIRCTDLTTLEGKDSEGRVRSLCAKAISPRPGWPNVPSVAAVCVYPNLVAVAKDALRGSPVKVASVATAFPSGLSSMDVKLADTASAIASGADEILSEKSKDFRPLADRSGRYLLGDISGRRVRRTAAIRSWSSRTQSSAGQ